MTATYYLKGDWNALCDVCGFKYKASDLRLRWDGLRVCDADWELRHPQDFVHGVPDTQSVPWSRPRPADVFTYTCSASTRNGTIGLGAAGCMIVGYQNTVA